MSACSRCGAEVVVPASVARRYPGWTPRLCGQCHREGEVGRQADSLLDGLEPSAPSRPGRVGQPELLTIAQVLARHHDGPVDGVFTDGSCMPNPGPGGWGAVHVVGNEVVAQAHGHAEDTTNNRMELEAIAQGLALVPPGAATVIHTDSRLCVDTLTKWAPGWARRGWQRKSGEVANLDLVRPLYEALQQRPEVELRWVRAHAGNRWNEYADALATAWARREL